MNTKERKQFRTTKVWKDFRKYMKKLQHNTDPITKHKLLPRANLHHLDMNVNRYDNLDPSHFVFLNSKTHDTIHFLYTYWVRDPDVLKRIEILLKEMYRLTNSK